jgi:hypothetical protein
MMPRRALPWLLLLYCAASLLHFWHNAEYVADYPNLPRWITGASVYATWLVIALFGLTGYLLFRRRHRMVGLGLLAVYAAFGFDGLLHYTRAPLSAHTLAMNVTILAEVITAGVALSVVAWLAYRPEPLATR